MKPVFVFVHHTAVSHSKNPDQWDATNEFHKKEFNMKSSLGFYVGYNYEISRDGVVRKAREEGEETAAVKGYNKNSVSVCMDGNFDIELPTEAQKVALTKLLKEICARHSIPFENVRPHRSVAQKSCYGSKLPNDWAMNLLKAENPLKKFTTQELINELQRRINAKEL